MYRHPDQARVVHQATGDPLTNPLGGIGGKPQLPGVIKFPSRHNQSNVALLDEIHQGDPPPAVLSGHSHHQTQVTLDHPADCPLVSGGTPHGQLPLLLWGQAGILADFPEIGPQLLLPL